MLYVCYCAKSSESGRALARALGCVGVNFNSRKMQNIKSGDTLVNFGSSNLPYMKNVKIINHPENIAQASNKRISRILLEKHNVPAPKLYTNPQKIDRFPVIGRPDYHTQGKEFYYCTNKQELKKAHACGATHYMSFLKNTTEFRIHIVSRSFLLSEQSLDNFLVVKSSVKLPVEENPHPYIKNYENGYKFFPLGHCPYPAGECIHHVWKVAQMAARAVKLHFCAVDLALSGEQAYVYEINTAPCLVNSAPSANKRSTVNIYADNLSRYLLKNETVKDVVRQSSIRTVEYSWR